MAGEITLRELSPSLREFIENSGGGGSINANIKTCGFTATQGQTTFTIPFENYVAEECYLDVKVNSIWVSPEEYTVNGKDVTFNTALEVGTEVFFTVYLLGATAVSSVSADVVVENENRKFVTAQEKSKIAEIDVLSKERGYLNSKNVTTSTDDCTVNGKYYGSSSVLNLPESYSWVMDVIRYNDNFIYQIIHMGSGRVFFRLKISSGWQPWQQIATTTKTPFSLTANAGFTIQNQNCYKINNVAYIKFEVKRTNGTAFYSMDKFGTCPYFNGVTSLSVVGADLGGSVVATDASAYINATGDMRVLLSETNVGLLYITGEVVL